jgi:hypothetical protein
VSMPEGYTGLVLQTDPSNRLSERSELKSRLVQVSVLLNLFSLSRLNRLYKLFAFEARAYLRGNTFTDWHLGPVL